MNYHCWPNPAVRPSIAGCPVGKFTDCPDRPEPTQSGRSETLNRIGLNFTAPSAKMATTARPFGRTDNPSDSDAFSRPAREHFVIRLDTSRTEADPNAGLIVRRINSFRNFSSLCFWIVVERVVLKFKRQQTNDFNWLALKLVRSVDYFVDRQYSAHQATSSG